MRLPLRNHFILFIYLTPTLKNCLRVTTILNCLRLPTVMNNRFDSRGGGHRVGEEVGEEAAAAVAAGAAVEVWTEDRKGKKSIQIIQRSSLCLVEIDMEQLGTKQN